MFNFINKDFKMVIFPLILLLLSPSTLLIDANELFAENQLAGICCS